MTKSAERVLAYMRRRAGWTLLASELQGVAGPGVSIETVMKEVERSLRAGEQMRKVNLKPKNKRHWELHYRLAIDVFERPATRNEKQMALPGTNRSASHDR